MANTKLHIICGNCGCATMFVWDYLPSDVDSEADVYIKCENCSTLHCLSNNAKERNPHANAQAMRSPDESPTN